MNTFETLRYFTTYEQTLKSLQPLEERMKKMNAFGEQMKALSERTDRLQRLFAPQQGLIDIGKRFSFAFEDNTSNLRKMLSEHTANSSSWYADYARAVSANRSALGLTDSPFHNKVREIAKQRLKEAEFNAEADQFVSSIAQTLPQDERKSFVKEWRAMGTATRANFVAGLLAALACLLFMNYDDSTLLKWLLEAGDPRSKEAVGSVKPGPMCIDTTL